MSVNAAIYASWDELIHYVDHLLNETLTFYPLFRT
jgi:hypothetical protein